MEIKIQVPFTVETNHGTYSDAIYFTPDEYAKQTESSIKALQDERVACWINSIENTPAPATPTIEDLIQTAQDQQAQLDATIDQIKAIDPTIKEEDII